MENKRIKKLLDNGNITKEQYKILFEDKSTWSEINEEGNQDWNNAKTKIELFNTTLKTIINLQKSIDFEEKQSAPFINLGYSKKHITLDYIAFPKFTLSDFLGHHIKESISFQFAGFFGEANFNQCVFEKGLFFHGVKFFQKSGFYMTTFKHNVYFNSNVYFYDSVDFFNTRFMNIVSFDDAEFHKDSRFYNTSFESTSVFKKIKSFNDLDFSDSVFSEDTDFDNATFKKLISFNNVTFKKMLIFSNVKLGILELSRIQFQKINLLGLENIQNKPLIKDNFFNKETSRIIKYHFEKQNNLSEANKYFALEQDKYLEELIKKGIWRNKGTIFPVFLNKIISYHGNSWLKVLMWIITFTLAIYYLHHDIPQTKVAWGELPHKALELIDPLKMFREEDNLSYKDKELWEFLSRITILYLFWQFIVSFRQSTRRK